MSAVSYREANRRYRRAFTGVMILYSLLCFGAPMLLEATGEAPKWAWGLAAILTGAPIAGVFWLLGRYLRETDEYTRRLQSDALMTAGGVTLSFAGIWGFLDLYDVAPPLWAFWLVPLFFAVYGGTTLLQRLRGQREEGC